MSVNRHAVEIARKHGRGYHEVRIAVNRLVNLAGWNRARAELYVDEVLAAENDLESAVDAAVSERAQ